MKNGWAGFAKEIKDKVFCLNYFSNKKKKCRYIGNALKGKGFQQYKIRGRKRNGRKPVLIGWIEIYCLIIRKAT